MTISNYHPSERWTDALGSFESDQRARGFAPATVMQRCARVSRFSRSTEKSPWDVQRFEILNWLDTLPISRSAKMSHRQALRVFYRWATSHGYLAADPTDEPVERCKPLPTPPNWERVILEFRTFLRASGRPETTIQTRLGHMRRFARAHPSLKPADVSFDDLIVWLSGHNWTSEYRRGNRGSLVAFFGWLAGTGRAAHNAAERLPVVKAGQPKPRPVQDDEYAKALHDAKPREYLALRLSAELGLRRAEVASVHSRDLTGTNDNCTLSVTGKGNKQRDLPVPRSLATVLREQPDGYVFPGAEHGHVSPRWLGKLISELLPQGVTMHGLRHRFATRAYNIDRDVFTVQQLLGHASPATTQRYVKVTSANMRRLVEAAA